MREGHAVTLGDLQNEVDDVLQWRSLGTPAWKSMKTCPIAASRVNTRNVTAGGVTGRDADGPAAPTLGHHVQVVAEQAGVDVESHGRRTSVHHPFLWNASLGPIPGCVRFDSGAHRAGHSPAT